jgi:hypothetical protein
MGERLDRVIKALRQIETISWEVATSLAHLIAVVPKLFSAILTLIAEFDTLEEAADLLNELVERVLKWFKNRAGDAKNKI